MSFAEEFGHDIPNDYDDGYGGNKSSGYYSGRGSVTLEKCHINSIERTTAKAYLVKFKDNSKAWIPKSESILSNDSKIISIPTWMLTNLKFVK